MNKEILAILATIEEEFRQRTARDLSLLRIKRLNEIATIYKPDKLANLITRVYVNLNQISNSELQEIIHNIIGIRGCASSLCKDDVLKDTYNNLYDSNLNELKKSFADLEAIVSKY